MITYDTHLHTTYSHDGSSSLIDTCESAISKGLNVICPTEHIFFDPRDVGYGYFDLEAYIQGIEVCKTKYKGRVTVLSGVEFSEPHLYPHRFKEIQNAPIDMIVGAMHWLDDGFFGDPKVIADNTAEILLDKYFNRIMDVVEFGGFDTLAHMDLIKRYVSIGDDYMNEKVEKVLEGLIRQEIALELNTSTIRRDGLEASASFRIVDRYIEMGGLRLTVGSDAHCAEDIGADFGRIPERYHPFIGYFIQRQFVKA